MSIGIDKFDSIARYDAVFSNFPKKEFFRLYIDKAHHALGENAFDNDRNSVHGEPGYRAGMEAGFSHIRMTLGMRVNAQFLKELHDTCVHDVKVNRYVPGSYGGSALTALEKGFVCHSHYGFLVWPAFRECEERAKK